MRWVISMGLAAQLNAVVASPVHAVGVEGDPAAVTRYGAGVGTGVDEISGYAQDLYPHVEVYGHVETRVAGWVYVGAAGTHRQDLGNWNHARGQWTGERAPGMALQTFIGYDGEAFHVSVGPWVYGSGRRRPDFRVGLLPFGMLRLRVGRLSGWHGSLHLGDGAPFTAAGGAYGLRLLVGAPAGRCSSRYEPRSDEPDRGGRVCGGGLVMRADPTVSGSCGTFAFAAAPPGIWVNNEGVDGYEGILFELAPVTWAGPQIASLRGRVLHLALFQACLRAYAERSDRGARFDLIESKDGAAFAMGSSTRQVRFELVPGADQVRVTREGFPSTLVPDPLRSEVLTAHETKAACDEQAREQVGFALRILFRRTE